MEKGISPTRVGGNEGEKLFSQKIRGRRKPTRGRIRRSYGGSE
jgi:hypothetical protein